MPLPENPEEPLILRLIEQEHLSFQEAHQLREMARDFQLWQEGSLAAFWDDTGLENHKGKNRRTALLARLRAAWNRLKETPTDYATFTPPPPAEAAPDRTRADQTGAKPIMGRCPVAGAATRCCQLQTLDAVEQCGFGCAYCSIRTFYGAGPVRFHTDLRAKLDAVSAQLDPTRYHHIGTGQSSDSLMWGNHNSLLAELVRFAAANPRVILELKSKSASVEPLLSQAPLPRNIVATWSLNPQIIITAEEHGTASLEARLTAARRAADAGLKVGFHFHPMILHKGWRDNYGALFADLQRRFSPDEVLMISLGTLTFIKPVIKQIRAAGLPTRVHQIPLTEAAGKLSYPLEIKEEMFRFAYNSFGREWREQVFFYLCMEDPRLWQPVFGFEYSDDEEFEAAMLKAYAEKLGLEKLGE